MGYKDLMKKVDLSFSNPLTRIEAKRVEVFSSQTSLIYAAGIFGAYLTLENIDFDKDRGFVWSGDVEVWVGGYKYTKGDHKYRDICVRTAPDENSRFYTWFRITIEKGKKPKVDDIIGKDVRVRNCQDSVESGCYQDLQPLFEDYFWDFLRAAYNNAASDGQIVQQIEELALGEAVSSYLRELIAAYNDSYIRNKGALEKRGALLGYPSSQQRYGICVSDENFQRAVDAQKRFLEMRFDNNLGFLVKNFVGDEAKYFLYKVDSLQKDFQLILQEFGWRLAPIKTDAYGTEWKGNVTKRLVKGFEKLYETLTDGLITKEEKARIRTLEKAIFTGDKTARAAYDSLVGELKGRYLSKIDEVERLYNAFYSCKLDDGSVDKYSGFRTNTDGIACIQNWIRNARKNFENLGYELKGTPAEKKRQEFERRIDRLLSVSTYVGKDGREREMTVLDRCGQVILEKAESIEEMKDAAFKKREYELLIKDVEALREIQYLIGVYGKNKAALLYGPDDAQRRAVFGENSGYVSADRFFAKIEEALSPRDGLGTEERIDFLIKTDYILEDIGRKLSRDDFRLKLESVLGKRNGAVTNRGLGQSLFGDADIEEIFLQENGNIDLKKLTEARKSILHALEEIQGVPAKQRKASGEVKYTLDDSLIQAAKKDKGMRNALRDKLLVIDDQILAIPSDGGAAYQTANSSGSGSFGEVSDFLSTDAYLDKLYAKINGGSIGTGSFGKFGHSDAGGAWHDGTGEGKFSLKKILKIGLAVVIVLFLLRACGGIF